MELLQDADVVLEELAQVGDAVLEHRDPLDPHAEREALHEIRVIAVRLDEAEDVGIHHPRAQDLDPARSLADRVPRAVRELARATAVKARDVDLDARFREREEAGAKSRAALGAEDGAGELIQRPLEVRERDRLRDRQALDLVEDRAVGRVERVAAVTTPWYHDEDRRPLALHRAHLHGRGVGAKDDVLRPRRQRRAARLLARQGRRRRQLEVGVKRRGVDVEGVLGHPRRMAGRMVESREVVVVELDLRALHDPVAEAAEDVLDLAHRANQEVPRPHRDGRGAGQGDVHGVGGQAGFEAGSLERIEAMLEERLELLAGDVRGLPDGAALLGGKVPDAPQYLSQLRLPAQVADPQLLELGGVRRGLDGLLGLTGQLLDFSLDLTQGRPSYSRPRRWPPLRPRRRSASPALPSASEFAPSRRPPRRSPPATPRAPRRGTGPAASGARPRAARRRRLRPARA